MAMAFERKETEKIVEGILDIGAVSGRPSRRNPEESRQCHDMIDAQRARVPHIGAQRRQKRLVRGVGQPCGNERRQAPVLAAHVEGIRRGPDAGAQRVQVLIRPRFGAAAIDGHRQIGIKADREARDLCPIRGAGELELGLPLQVDVILDAFGVLRRIASDGARHWIAIGQRPGGPPPHGGVFRVELLLQRFEERMEAQRIAAARDIGLERIAARIAWREMMLPEMIVEKLEYRSLRFGDARVVDERNDAQRLQHRLERGRRHPRARARALPELRDGLDVDVEDIAEQPARRTVRARVPGLMREERMQRIDADDACPARAPLLRRAWRGR